MIAYITHIVKYIFIIIQNGILKNGILENDLFILDFFKAIFLASFLWYIYNITRICGLLFSGFGLLLSIICDILHLKYRYILTK